MYAEGLPIRAMNFIANYVACICFFDLECTHNTIRENGEYVHKPNLCISEHVCHACYMQNDPNFFCPEFVHTNLIFLNRMARVGVCILLKYRSRVYGPIYRSLRRTLGETIGARTGQFIKRPDDYTLRQ